MSTEDDLEKLKTEESEKTDEEVEPRVQETRSEDVDSPETREANEALTEAAAAAPVQLGYMRFVYAAYMGGAMGAAYLLAKIGHVSWYRLGQWKTELGEPKDEIVYPLAGLLGVGVALYYWRKASARQYATEVAEELSKVTWPSRKEVSNSTTVVVATTIFATVFFALMDQFWKFVTDKIYSFNGSF